MTSDELAPDVRPLDYLPTADEAAEHRAHVVELQRQVQAAREAVENLSHLADSWHTEGVWLPFVTESGEDVLDKDTWGQPCGNEAVHELQRTLRDAARQAYAIAGHYGRVTRRLTTDLNTELRTPWTAYRVLTFDELGRLGYVKPSDEWMDGGEPLGGHAQQIAHRLQQAGLLPNFDGCFTPAAEPEASTE